MQIIRFKVTATVRGSKVPSGSEGTTPKSKEDKSADQQARIKDLKAKLAADQKRLSTIKPDMENKLQQRIAKSTKRLQELENSEAV